ncbi:16S rRNA (cytosine(967)-C(5))-methyltransferase RsmB [Ectothiorhodospira marina]|uniref:16S rRNA (cytosine(967)-C(5))-methyltransferase n=1 Tax=Ectothiorhodospira marina TaxID=1396821 RepID=A0A1H7JTU8_9GAMM|nr:16S rRNA (cytosine(967)-C(5))-methyltransferase RsmB [Ectothiorhodospira marina]SEK77716.1 16S rRNA (cytosine967-C5)-methyltransferase [Ectothiorhodospira marina]
MSPREAALKVLLRVLKDGASLSDALPHQLQQVPPRDRGLTQALCYGTLRWHRRLQAMLDGWMDKPLRGRDQDVACALLMGLFEMQSMNTPDYAVIQQTADLGRSLRKRWAVGLINGVLRRAQREGEARGQQVDQSPALRHALPDWLFGCLQQAYGADVDTLCQAMNAHPPMTLRVNLHRGSRADYQARLAAAGLQAHPLEQVPSALILSEPVAVETLPGFQAGEVSVQDAAAQLAAPLLDCHPGQRVLDACAAPGGKTLHLLEQAGGDLDITALDSQAGRLDRVRENLDRGRYQARLVAGDGARPEDWHQGAVYDRILLDVPCSATGVIRRHPDIKLLRRDADIPALATEQARLLRALWPLLAPGGMLLYVTCSLLPDENDLTVAQFLHDEPSASESPLQASWGRARTVGRQILTGDQEMDGFYYARLIKR